jgi:hypothetical protein
MEIHTMKVTQAEQYSLLAEALRDFHTYAVFNQVYIDQFWYWKALGVDCGNGHTLRVDNFVFTLSINIPWKKVPYDKLLDCEGLRLSTGNDIAVEHVVIKLLPSGLQVKSIISSYAAIPKKDIDTLRDLGKINAVLIPYQPARVEETIFCPNLPSPSPIPF